MSSTVIYHQPWLEIGYLYPELDNLYHDSLPITPAAISVGDLHETK